MPCCIDRMRFSPRFSIRRKRNSFLFFSFIFFYAPGTCPWSGPCRTHGWRGGPAQPPRHQLACAQKRSYGRACWRRKRTEGSSYLLGLLAKIKCSICSYQLNLWYVAHGVTWDLSELFKPRLGACGACAAPWPNVALVLQYCQALRVSPTLSCYKI